MKKLLISLSFLLAAASVSANDFSSEISRINATGFPKIEVFFKVFNK